MYLLLKDQIKSHSGMERQSGINELVSLIRFMAYGFLTPPIHPGRLYVVCVNYNFIEKSNLFYNLQIVYALGWKHWREHIISKLQP